MTKLDLLKKNSYPAKGEHVTGKYNVDEAISISIDESSMLRLYPYENLEKDSNFLKSTLTSPKTRNELPTKSYVDGLHENTRNRREFSTVFNDQNIEFDEEK